MSKTALDTQVIVVGAGPVGLLLAAELRLGGAAVIVLERLASPATESRASTLHARTIEIFDSRGLLDRFGQPPRETRGHFGGIPLEFSQAPQWKVPQPETERVLGDWASSLGADIRRDHEVQRVTLTPDYAEVLAGGKRLRALCVVGCDGQNSTVRQLTSAPFSEHGELRELLRADVAGIEIEDRRFQRLPNGLAIASRAANGVTRVMVHEFGRSAGRREGAPSFAEVVDTWRRVTGEDIGHGRPLWLNSFDDANQQLLSYRDGRLLFAGDAAHRQLPAGGQALNLGLHDSFNLGWKLAIQVSGRASSGLLDSYHDERHRVGRRVLSNIAAQAMLLLGGPEVEPTRQVFGELLRFDPVRDQLTAMIAGLDVRYDVGAGTHPLLGARLPNISLDTAAGPVGAQSLLRDGRAVLIDLSDDPAQEERLRHAAVAWSDRVTVLAARPTRGPADDSLLVRPDGHVAWTGRDTAGLPEALHRWLGLPAATTRQEQAQLVAASKS